MNGEPAGVDAWPHQEVVELLRRALESAAQEALAAGATPDSVAAYLSERTGRIDEARDQRP